MADKTGISWTEATWNPTTGCDRISPGCDHCYALDMAARLKLMGSAKYQADGDPTTSGPGFKLTIHPETLDQPLRWTRPRLIFVNSMSDLFHQDVPIDFIAEVFTVMALADHHRFQVLTKRPQRMAQIVGSDMFWDMVQLKAEIRLEKKIGAEFVHIDRPLANVWLGTTIENDRYAWRANYLRSTPAAVRFLSLEPLIGAVPSMNYEGIDWAIVGGESGPKSRPMDPDWVRDIRDQCAAAGTAFYLKQTGVVLAAEWGLKSHKGDQPDEWPEEFRIQEYPS